MTLNGFTVNFHGSWRTDWLIHVSIKVNNTNKRKTLRVTVNSTQFHYITGQIKKKTFTFFALKDFLGAIIRSQYRWNRTIQGLKN